LPSVRGDLLVKLGRFEEARPEFERAASLTRNSRERALLLERAQACAAAPDHARLSAATPIEPA
jgi:predicted RNA polymerase sigma factor